MIKGQRVKLEIDGNPQHFIFVGAGATTFCFKHPLDKKQVYLFIPDIKFKDGTSLEDTTKDTLVRAYQSNKANPYLPKIENKGRHFVDGPELNRFCKVYTMPYYRDIRKSDKKQWLEMKKLQKLRDDGYHTVYGLYNKQTGNDPSMTFLGVNSATWNKATAKEKVNVILYSALKSIFDNINTDNKGTSFEFNRRNIGIDLETGHLILRDVLYDSEITTHIKNDRKTD